MIRLSFKYAAVAVILAVTSGSATAQSVSVADPLTGYTITKDSRKKTCHASTDLQSINGKDVGLTLHLTQRGKASQTLAYGNGAKPKKRKDTMTVQFDGSVFYTRKVRLGRDGIFEFPHRNRRETARFVGKLTSSGNMVILLRDNKDGLVVGLSQMADVVTALQACADTF